MSCDYCDETFGSRKDEINHIFDEHDDELTSHDRDELKRERNKLAAQDDGDLSSTLRTAGIAGAAIFGVVAVAYALTATGVVSFSTGGGTTTPTGDVPLGAAGSTHEHMPFSIVVNGERVDFSQPKYQRPRENPRIHFEGGDGSTIHKHATGVTIGYALQSLDMDLNATCLTMDTGETYCEDDSSDLSVTAGGNEIEDDPASYVLREGEGIRIAYSEE